MATTPPLSRRALLAGLGALPFVGALASLSFVPHGHAVAAPRGGNARPPPPDTFLGLENAHGGRLGVCLLDTGTGERFGHRLHERFAMCSTFKAPLAGLVLARVDRGEETLDRAIPVATTDLVSHSPVVEKHVAKTMTLRELCHATVTLSDNAAANLILATVGGPAGLTTFARSLGDTVTRLDRTEPEMNVVDLKNGDERDTTSPAAMAALMSALTVGTALSPGSRDVLVGWLRETSTGLNRLRAGLPKAWNPGDKTGSGPKGETNDVAVAWPPGRAPILIAAYYEGVGKDYAKSSAVLAEVGRIVAGLA